MVKGWRKQFQTEEQRQEFDLFFKEFETFEQSQPEAQRGKQAPINIFLISQIILLRSELKQLRKKEVN